MTLDGFGIYGTAFVLGAIALIIGSSFLLFLYNWWNGRLDFDEGPAIDMMKEDHGQI